VSILEATAQLNLHSRSEEQIENLTDRNFPYAGMLLACEAVKQRYRNCVHRPIGPTAKYNCHGLTFASRRTGIEGKNVDKILKQDEYEEVQIGAVMAGDIVVYRNFDTGDAEHSGIVIQTHPNLLVLSKWGDAHEAIHRIDDGPYVGRKTFHRIIDEPRRI
jgi:hypothetical protein